MRVKLDIGLDFNGLHTFEWTPSEAQGAVEVPRALLERWAKEREAFRLAAARWQHVTEEIEEFLYRTEQARQAPGSAREPSGRSRLTSAEVKEAAVVALSRSRRPPKRR